MGENESRRERYNMVIYLVSLLFKQTEETISTISIINLLGKTVYNNEYNSEKVQVDVSALPAGVYFVKVNGMDVKKFLKE